MNLITKILIGVISACCAVILIYFLVSKSNGFEHDHPKNISTIVNDSHSQNFTFKSINSNNFNVNTNEVMQVTGNPMNTLESFKAHENYKLFNNERCGIDTGKPRIHNGKATGLMDNPWMVALVYLNENTNITSVDCAGTLISGKCDPLFSCVKSYGMEIIAGIIH
jgi:hypothetical protein